MRFYLEISTTLSKPEARCGIFTIPSCSGLTLAPPFGAAVLLEHWKSFLRPIVITSLSFIIPICVVPLFLYCTALWIDS